MIEPRELRIGNLVQAFGKTVEVIAIEKAGIAHKHDDIREVYAAQDYLSPIPLTEEWLEKMGFKCVDTWVMNGEDVCQTHQHSSGMIVHQDNDKLYSTSHNQAFKKGIDLLSVHSLQNLFFILTGQELTYTT